MYNTTHEERSSSQAHAKVPTKLRKGLSLLCLKLQQNIKIKLNKTIYCKLIHWKYQIADLEQQNFLRVKLLSIL